MFGSYFNKAVSAASEGTLSEQRLFGEILKVLVSGDILGAERF